MSLAPAQCVPVRVKRIRPWSCLDDLEVWKLRPYLIGRDAFRKESAAAHIRLAPKRIEQVGGARSRHPGDLANVCRLSSLRQRVKAALVEEQVESRLDGKVMQPCDLAHKELDRYTCYRRLGAGATNRSGDEIDGGHVPAFARHVDGCRAGSATKVKRPTDRKLTRALDDLDQLRWRYATVPWGEPTSVCQPEEEVGDQTHRVSQASLGGGGRGVFPSIVDVRGVAGVV